MVNKKEFIWNMIASISASALSSILLLIVTRVNGTDEAGIFSIAFATATVLYTIADYGMRIFHVTDTDRKYNFNTYLLARTIVDLLMVIVGIVVVYVKGYDYSKALACIAIVIFRFADGLSETFQGEFQLSGKLDIAGKSVTFRMLISIVVFMILDIVSCNLVLALIIMAITNLLGTAIYDLINVKKIIKEKGKPDKKAALRIIVECFPVFFSTFLNIYIINAPKYAIDKYLTNSEQTYFNIIYLPTFTINLLSIFILKPMLKQLGELWNENKKKELNIVIYKMSAFILVITAFIMIVCYFIGIPILEIIYNVELSQYKMALMYLLFSGGLSALCVMLLYVLTTMRCQYIQIAAYIIAAIAAYIILNIFVSNYGILGASISSVIIMTILAVSLYIIYLWESLWKKK